MKTLENQIKIYLRVFTFMGQFPFQIKKEGLKSSNLLKLSGLIVAIPVVITAILRVTLELPQFSIKDNSLRVTFTAFGVVLTAATIIIPIYKSDLYFEVFHRFGEVEKYFRYIGITIEEHKNINPSLSILLKNLVVLVLVNLVEVAIPYWDTYIMPFYGKLFYYFTSAIMMLVTINCETYAHFLVTRYDAINKALKNIEKEFEYKEISDDFRKINIVPPARMSREVTVENLRLLQRSHYELCGICSSLSELLTLPIVLSILGYGCEILVAVHEGLAELLNHEMVNLEHIFANAKFVVASFYRIIWVLKAFTSVEKKGNRTAYHVQGLILKTEDTETQKELTKFSRQLHHHKLHYSNLGFFSLDMSLLVSMTGSITTYLVILLQSSGKEQKCPKIEISCPSVNITE